MVGQAAPGSIVTLEPVGTLALTAPTEPSRMDQFDRAFYPELLVATVGQPVQFSNSESELHNVRIIDTDERTQKETTVFYAVLEASKAQAHVFDKPGFYDVRCDFHESMHAEIFVAPTPHALIVGDEGTFTFPAVAPGPYKLSVMTQGQERVQQVNVAAPRTELAN